MIEEHPILEGMGSNATVKHNSQVRSSSVILKNNQTSKKSKSSSKRSIRKTPQVELGQKFDPDFFMATQQIPNLIRTQSESNTLDCLDFECQSSNEEIMPNRKKSLKKSGKNSKNSVSDANQTVHLQEEYLSRLNLFINQKNYSLDKKMEILNFAMQPGSSKNQHK